ADPSSVDAFATLAAALRTAGYANLPLDDGRGAATTRLVLGRGGAERALVADLGAPAVAALHTCGAIAPIDTEGGAGEVEAAFTAFPAGTTPPGLPPPAH